MVEPCNTENLGELGSELTENQPTSLIGHFSAEFQQWSEGFLVWIQAAAHKEANGLAIKNNLTGFSGVNDGSGFLY